MNDLSYTSYEMMIAAAARLFRNGATCFVGVGLPSVAACVARSVHAPHAVLIYESGAMGAKPSVPPLSIADPELAATADFLVSLPEVFSYWLQAGRIETAFLGAGQIDRFGNVNSTVIGDYAHPRVRMPGAGGAPEIASGVAEAIVIVKHTPRAFVAEVDFVTTRLQGKPLTVVTDLAILASDSDTAELNLVSCHPGVSLEQVRSATGWPLAAAKTVGETPAPSMEELAALRGLERAPATAPQPQTVAGN